MQRYFMHLYNGIGFLPDPDGVSAEDLDAACAIAVTSVRSLLAEEVKDGMIDFRGRIEVTDATGNCLHILRFRDAVCLRLEDDHG